MSDLLQRTWGAFTDKRAGEYLKTHGHGSLNSKRIVCDLLKEKKNPNLSVIDLGCGNAQMHEYFREQNLIYRYTGVDCSDPLLRAAKRADPEANFIKDDVNELSLVTGRYDVAVFSHVIEILTSPERSLMRAKSFADSTIIRFFEPPDFEFDSLEILDMDVGAEKTVPYVRRKMSRDYYRLILTKLGCTSVDVHRDATSKDQVHVLHY